MGTVRRMTAKAPRQAPAVTAAVALGVVEARAGERHWRVRVGAEVVTAACDASVDPALVDEAMRAGARVVLDLAGAPVIAGALATARAVSYDRDGSVMVDARRFVVTAAEEALLRTRAAFVQVKGADVEAFGERVVSRAREVLKLIGRNVRIN
jgi:hypothetical protein